MKILVDSSSALPSCRVQGLDYVTAERHVVRNCKQMNLETWDEDNYCNSVQEASFILIHLYKLTHI